MLERAKYPEELVAEGRPDQHHRSFRRSSRFGLFDFVQRKNLVRRASYSWPLSHTDVKGESGSCSAEHSSPARSLRGLDGSPLTQIEKSSVTTYIGLATPNEPLNSQQQRPPQK